MKKLKDILPDRKLDKHEIALYCCGLIEKYCLRYKEKCDIVNNITDNENLVIMKLSISLDAVKLIEEAIDIALLNRD